MKKTINASTGHTICVSEVTAAMCPRHPGAMSGSYTHLYTARNWDETGSLFFYLARGYTRGGSGAGERQWHVWYPNGMMWSGFGNTIQEAIDGAQRDGWLPACNRERE